MPDKDINYLKYHWYRRFLGYGVDEVAGKTLQDLEYEFFSSVDPEALAEAIEELTD